MGSDDQDLDAIATQELRSDRSEYSGGGAEDRARAERRLDEEDLISRTMGNGGTTTGRRHIGGETESPDAHQRRENDKRDVALLVAELNEQLAALRAQREALFDRLTEIEEEREAIQARAEERREAMAHWQQVAERAEQTQTFDRNPDGSLADSKLEALVSAHEQRTGRKIDRDDFDAIYLVLTQEQERLREERRNDQARDQELEQEAKVIAAEINEIDRKISEAERALEAGSPDALSLAISSIDDKYERKNLEDIAASHTETEINAPSEGAGFQFKF